MHFEPFNIPLQAINDDVTRMYGLRLFILRTDLPHRYFQDENLLHEEQEIGNNLLYRQISGNKFFKLKYNLLEAEKKGIKTLLPFGGAISNHISATAAAGKEYGFKTIGIIRGEAYPALNPTLQFAVECGMRLFYVPRALYRDKKELYAHVNKQFSQEIFYLIPEGGSNELGVLGCKEITQYISTDFNHVCCACGTGATMAGIILSLKNNQKAIGFQVLKAEGYIKNEVEQWVKKEPRFYAIIRNNGYETEVDEGLIKDNWTINEDYHFGGYTKVQPELTDFIKWFGQTNRIPLDRIYTGKLMFGIYDKIRKGCFKRGETVVAIHTGGLQGDRGLKC